MEVDLLLETMTLKKIGEMAGVHRSTVDKVIHNRKGVSVEVRQRIKRIIEEVGYTPNIVGKALSRQKKPLSIAVVLPEFNALKEIKSGIKEAYKEYKSFGLNINYHIINSMDETEQLNAINYLKTKNISGMIISPINTIKIRDAIDNLIKNGIPVVTVNSDIPESKRMCFVGQDLIMAGKVAGELMGEILDDDGKVAILTSSETLWSSRERQAGFENVVFNKYPGIEVVDILETKENKIIAFEKTLSLLKNVDKLRGIYVACGTASEVAKAVKLMHKENEIKIICFDLYPEIVELVKEGVVNFTIGQDLFGQGYKSVKVLFENLFFNKKPETNYIQTSIDIRLKENIDLGSYI